VIKRFADVARLRTALDPAPVVLLVGPRQAGKSTLARGLAGEADATFFDLEDPTAAARLAEPMLALQELRGLVILDEARHAPHLFRC
jgi:uncharacterized protein